MTCQDGFYRLAGAAACTAQRGMEKSFDLFLVWRWQCALVFNFENSKLTLTSAQSVFLEIIFSQSLAVRITQEGFKAYSRANMLWIWGLGLRLAGIRVKLTLIWCIASIFQFNSAKPALVGMKNIKWFTSKTDWMTFFNRFSWIHPSSLGES